MDTGTVELRQHPENVSCKDKRCGAQTELTSLILTN